VLDPGLSFGTGQHPTTAFCLQQLVKRRLPSQTQSFLDIGTGSGILAISAGKLGYGPVYAIDFDPDAVRIARRNAQKNRVAHKIRIARQDISKWENRTKYSFICANLISTLLVAERNRILEWLDENGIVVLAGILRTEFEALKKYYGRAGMKLVAARSDKEWRSGAFAWRG
jgi:ribosomal protein L11 methyltransferase